MVEGYGNNMNPQDLPYYKIFSFEERIAARCEAEYYCTLCGACLFFSDIANIHDHLPSHDMICPECRHKHKERDVKL